MENVKENELAEKVLDISFRMHRSLGPGLLESVYEEVLSYELKKMKIQSSRQVGIPVSYEAVMLDIGFRADVIVEGKLIVEIKSAETIIPVHKKQLLTYLKLSGIKLGLLINFNEEFLKNGIKRIANGL